MVQERDSWFPSIMLCIISVFLLNSGSIWPQLGIGKTTTGQPAQPSSTIAPSSVTPPSQPIVSVGKKTDKQPTQEIISIGGKLEDKPPTISMFKQLFANAAIIAGGQNRTQAGQLLNQPHIASWYTQENRDQLFGTVAHLYQQALTLFVQGYHELALPIDAAQPFNYVVITFYDIINLYLDELKRQSNNLNVLQASNADMANALQLFRTFIATANGEITDLSHHIEQHSELATNSYTTKRNLILFSTYSLLLTNLASATKQPRAGPQALPDSYYTTRINEGTDYFEQLKAVRQQDLVIPASIYRSMASLYALRSLNALKTMDPAQDVSSLIRQATLAINQFDEAIKLYKTAANDAESKTLYPVYQRFREQLASGLALYDKASKESDLSEKVTLLHQAHDALLAGGADIFANKAERDAFMLQADNAVAKAQTLAVTLRLFDPQEFASHLSSAITNALTMKDSLAKLGSLYNEAAQSYALASAVDLPVPGTLQQKTTMLSSAQQMVGATVQALQKLTDGLQIAQRQTSDEENLLLNEAKSLFDQAIGAATNADRYYAVNGVAQYSPWYHPLVDLLKQSLFYTFKGLADAMESQQPAQSLTVPSVLYAYSMLAYLYRDAVPVSLAQELQTTLARYDLLGQAEDAYKKALQATDWQSDQAGLNTADMQWQEAATAAFAAYASWKLTGQFAGAEALYLTCVKEWATRYEQNVKVDGEDLGQVSLGAAIRLYRAYVVYVLQKAADDAQKTMQTINDLITVFFSQAQALQHQLQMTTLIADTVRNYTQLQAWQQLFAAALELQNQLIKNMQPLGSVPFNMLLTQASTKEQITYSSAFTKSTLTLPLQLELTLADLYVQQAKTATKHQYARDAYQQAIELYTKAGLVEKAEALQASYMQEKTLTQAEMYDDFVLPFGPTEMAFAGITVFASYFITVYLERIPASLALPQPLVDFLKKLSRASTQQQKTMQESAEGQQLLRTTLPVLAQAIYLYNALAANNGLNEIIGVDLYGLILHGKETDNPTIKPFLHDARSFGKKLMTMMQGVELGTMHVVTKLALFASGGNFSLIYGNRPVTALPEISSAHPWDPTALAYYTQSADKYKAAGKTDDSNRLQSKMNKTFLSHAYQLRERAQFMHGLERDEQLISMIASDEDELKLLKATKESLATQSTVLTPTIVQSISFIQLYYGAALGDIADITGITSDAGTASDDCNVFAGMLYEESADFLQSWLKGDPFSEAYQSFISPANQRYLLAQGAYQQAKKADKVRDIGTKIGFLFEKVGDACNGTGKFLEGIGYYTAAAKACENVIPRDSGALGRVRYKAVSAQFKGATTYFATYYDKRTTVDTTTRDTLLDALIFYASIADSAQKMYSDEPTDKLQQQAHERVMAYIDKNKATYFSTDMMISGTDQSQALTRFMLSDERLKHFTSQQCTALINDGFDYCAEPLTRHEVSRDESDCAVAAIMQWSGMVSGALSARYIHDFLPDSSPEDQLSDLLSAMKAETHQIFAPSDQYVGSFDSNSSL